jgi:hypothetical protein
MKIPRVILELGVEIAERANLTPYERRRQLRKHVLDIEVGDDGAEYQERIRSLLGKVAASRADIALFPAYTFIARSGHLTMTKWENLATKSGLSAVLGGSLLRAFPKPRGTNSEEHLMIVADGSPIFPLGENKYGPLPVMLGDRSAIAAMSSSVHGVRDYPRVFAAAAMRATKRSPLLIFGMGHDQYTGQYVKTLTTTVAAMEAEGAACVFLAVSFWRWKGGSTSTSWAFDGVDNATFDRSEVPIINHTGRIDYGDGFTV